MNERITNIHIIHFSLNTFIDYLRAYINTIMYICCLPFLQQIHATKTTTKIIIIKVITMMLPIIPAIAPLDNDILPERNENWSIVCAYYHKRWKFGRTLVWRITFWSRLAEEKLANFTAQPIPNNIKIVNWWIKVWWISLICQIR